MQRILQTLVALSLLTACVSTSSLRLGSNEYPEPPKSQSMPVYEVIHDVPGHAEKVGIVRAEAGISVSWDRMIRNLKREARCIGANAIVLVHEDGVDGTETRSVMNWADLRTSTYSLRQLSALAVRVHPDALPSSALPAANTY